MKESRAGIQWGFSGEANSRKRNSGTKNNLIFEGEIMDEKKEGALAVIAALIVLFSAMLDPIISVVISVVVLALFGIYKLAGK